MSYQERKRLAIENLRALKDQGREERSLAEEECAQQRAEDKVEVARRAPHPLSNAASEPPAYRRAVANVRALLRERDEACSEQDELRAAFGIGGDDSRDDDDDFVE